MERPATVRVLAAALLSTGLLAGSPRAVDAQTGTLVARGVQCTMDLGFLFGDTATTESMVVLTPTGALTVYCKGQVPAPPAQAVSASGPCGTPTHQGAGQAVIGTSGVVHVTCTLQPNP